MKKASKKSWHLVAKTGKKYGSYLSKHLQKEHPKTKGKISLRRL